MSSLLLLTWHIFGEYVDSLLTLKHTHTHTQWNTNEPFTIQTTIGIGAYIQLEKEKWVHIFMGA